jgi:hypothetical protein
MLSDILFGAAKRIKSYRDDFAGQYAYIRKEIDAVVSAMETLGVKLESLQSKLSDKTQAKLQ